MNEGLTMRTGDPSTEYREVAIACQSFVERQSEVARASASRRARVDDYVGAAMALDKLKGPSIQAGDGAHGRFGRELDGLLATLVQADSPEFDSVGARLVDFTTRVHEATQAAINRLHERRRDELQRLAELERLEEERRRRRQNWTLAAISVTFFVGLAAVIWLLRAPPHPVGPSPEPAPATSAGSDAGHRAQRPGPATVAPPDSGSEEAAKAARLAYFDLVSSFNNRNPTAYFSAFADPMDCFYRQASYPLGHLRKDRSSQFSTGGETLKVDELVVVRAAPAEVLLIDRGSWRDRRGRLLHHEKAILMRLEDSAWRVAVEVSRKTNGCFPGAFRALDGSQGDLTPCRTRLASCFAICDSDREASPNKETACLEGCQEGYQVCAGRPVPMPLRRIDFGEE